MNAPANRTALVASFVLAVIAGAAGAQDPAPPHRITFHGRETFSRRQLRTVVESDVRRFEKEGRAKSFLDDAAYALERFYRAEGFPDVEADFTLDAAAERPTVVFTIVEGPRVAIASVRLVGNDRYPTERLLALASVRRVREGAWYVRREVDADLDAIRGFYVGEGYVDAAVTEEAARVGPGRLDLTIRIREGSRVFLRDVVFRGGDRIPHAKLRGAVSRYLDHAFAPIVAEEVRAAVIDYYADHGFPFADATVAPRIDHEKGRVELELTVVAGARARFGRITVEGNERTWTRTILNTVRFQEGEPFNQEKLWKSQIALYDLGLFRRVTLSAGTFRPDPGEPTTSGRLDYVIRIEERDPWELEVYGGYGSYEQLRGGVTLRSINLLGGGRTAELSVQGSFKNRRAELTFIDPRTIGHHITLRPSAWVERREHPSFDLDEYSGRFDVGWQVSRAFELKLGYGFKASDASRVRDPDDFDADETIDIGSISAGFTWDRRDNPIDPTSGFYAGLTYEWANRALASELDFHRATGNLRGYYSPAEGWVVAAALRGGVIRPYADTSEIPVQERFYNGGESSVRSFKKFELGPKSGSDPIGGQAFLTINAEVRFPLYKWLGGAVFGDAGNVRERYQDFGYGDLRYAVGAGLHLKTPVGPIRFDYAQNPDPDDDEDDWNVHLSVGFAF